MPITPATGSILHACSQAAGRSGRGRLLSEAGNDKSTREICRDIDSVSSHGVVTAGCVLSGSDEPDGIDAGRRPDYFDLVAGFGSGAREEGPGVCSVAEKLVARADVGSAGNSVTPDHRRDVAAHTGRLTRINEFGRELVQKGTQVEVTVVQVACSEDRPTKH